MANGVSDTLETFPSFDDFKEAHNRIKNRIHETPIFTSRQADEKSGRRLYFKAENLQKCGSFKTRGALNAIIRSVERNPNLRGVITYSSGNHGLGTAWACQQVGVACDVCLRRSASQVKKDAVGSYGSGVVECGELLSDLLEECGRAEREKGFMTLHSFDHKDIIAGQGTVGLEFLRQVPDLDALLVPVCGGGLSSGVASVAKTIKPGIKVFLVTPPGKMMEQCLRSGKRPWSGPNLPLETLADGLALQQSGHVTTPVLIQLAEKDVFEMSDEEIVEGMKFCFERMKLVIEPSAGAVVAAALSDKFKAMDPDIKNVGVVLCGGNLDIENLPW